MTTPAETRRRMVLQIAEELRATQAKARTLEAQLDDLLANGSSQPKARRATSQPTDGSAASRILAVFIRQPGKKVTTQAVVTELAEVDAGLIRSTIARFARDKKLKRVGRGVYKSAPIAPDAGTEE